MIKLVDTTHDHLVDLWDIVQEAPEFWDDDTIATSFVDFQYWFCTSAMCPLTGTVDDEVIGCGYLDAIYPGYYGSVNIFKRKGRDRLRDEVDAFRGGLLHWAEGYNLEKLVGVIRYDNRPSRMFARAMGFKVDGVLRHHKRVNGVWTDYLLTSILRSEI